MMALVDRKSQEKQPALEVIAQFPMTQERTQLLESTWPDPIHQDEREHDVPSLFVPYRRHRMGPFCAVCMPFSGRSKSRTIFEWEKPSFLMHRGYELQGGFQVRYLEMWSGCKNVMSILGTETLLMEELA
jgi:hypothetical protein